MTEVILPIVLENLSSLIQNEIGLLWGVNKEMKKLESTLSTIRSVLEDAEQKQQLRQDKAIKNWLRKIKYIAYEVDDILDDCLTEASCLKFFRSGKNKNKKVCCLPSLNCNLVGNILFRHKIGNRMKEMRERLDEIAEERMKFHLREMVVEKRVGLSEIRQTGSVLTEPQVYGREADKEKIVETLTNYANDSEDLLVYPIIGMGGLGKTTLAQLVFNDERVNIHFEVRIWVCVSEDFDVKRILKAIVESASESPCEASDLYPLQRRLQKKLNEKRYLLVLDDVWNDNQEKWERLKYILQRCGSGGASIITTTRLDKVASIMGTLPSHRLIGLSEDNCWLLFKQRAFGSEREEHPNLVAIGKEIVKKCGGVPLAAKALGSLMRFKMEEKDWVFVKDNEIWNLPQDDETSILPALRLSYNNLPLELRQCFAYCAVYAKDTEIEKDDLIHLWMANGFISSANENMDVEDIGNEVWNELYWRSFFQDVQLDRITESITFKMHDLVHDLAQSVMDEECQIMEVKMPSTHVSNKRIHYLNLIACSVPLTTIPKELQNIDSLRTFLYSEKQAMDRTNSPDFSIFQNHGALRAFAARSSTVKTLAASIGSLKRLRYLRLQGTSITILPDSICSLWNLQTLNLYGCSMLQRLPEKMRCLRNLRVLLIDRCAPLIDMSPFIGDLTCLKTLNKYVVGKRKGCGLNELSCLNHLGGSLRIENLERVGNWIDAKDANLIAKQKLESLRLFWNTREYDSQENVEQVLEALQPHSNLQQLRIFSFKGTHFPLWMSDSSNLKNIVVMVLWSCKNCLQLPSLHQLPSLRILDLYEMNCVEYIINDDNTCGVQGGDNAVIRGFPCLEELYIFYLPNFKGLSKEEEEEEVGREPFFPRLRTLSISGCPRLSSIPASFQRLTNLQYLQIGYCPQLKMRCQKERGEDWYKIAHVPHVTVR